MGKFVIGCLAVVGGLVIAGALVGYFFFLRPALDFGKEAMRIGEEFQELEAAVEDQGPYDPPHDGKVSEDQLEQLLAVQADLRADLEDNLAALQEKYDELEEEIEAADRDLRLREMAEAYTDLGDLLLSARRAQVAALNEQGFSLEEYAWVRGQVYQAIGETVAVGMSQFTEGERPARSTDLHEDTVAMVEPHRERLLEAHALAWWGF